MKKSKLLKSIGFTSLAILMAAGGAFAFAPLGASPNTLANASEMVDTTTEQGLITPKADDPVIYTTESGLEIKYGNALPTVFGGGNEGVILGNLSGFPYFITKVNNDVYTWVIIGKSASGSYSNVQIGTKYGHEYQKLSYWQTNKAGSGTYGNFFDNTYEATTPAGLAIKNNNLLNDYAAKWLPDNYLLASSLSGIKATDEIPAGCVLVLANECVATGPYNTNYSYILSEYRFGQYYATNSDQKQAMANYYTNGSFGLSSIKSNIQSSTVKTYEYCYTNADNKGWSWRTPSVSAYIFPLCLRSDGSSTFAWETYLTANQMKLSINQWARGGGHGNNPNGADRLVVSGKSHYPTAYMNTNGEHTVGYPNEIYGYRPAFVLKIV